MIITDVASKSKVQLEVFELESGDRASADLSVRAGTPEEYRKYQALAINLVEPTIEVSEMQVLEIPELDLKKYLTCLLYKASFSACTMLN